MFVTRSEIKTCGLATVCEPALKRDEQVSVRIDEETVGDYTYVLGSIVLVNIMHQGSDLINVQGTVASLPSPTGVITACGTTDTCGGIRVSFELCCVRSTEMSVMRSLEWSSWIGRVKEILACGSKIIFSAVKISEV